MTCYWAKFEEKNGNIFRFDTRIYLKPIKKPSPKNDICIGAIVGKNPGSAKPSSNNYNTLQPIILDNDKLLPNVKNIVISAYNNNKKTLSENQYIQVLNLFYLCDKSLANAKRRIKCIGSNASICPSEKGSFPFIIYAWGGYNDGINRFKIRFIDKPLTENPIWFDFISNETRKVTPGKFDSVKHIQGLRHENIIPYLAEILRNMN